ncbi:heavy metal translocating P-type ATPase [Fundicoccus culcitae]|uniref:P-type Cu(+) transporter n=1 Tax=Fundicoccus culcitae TaxID=2969821 RepID=A0ABY5P9M6_9LACT|nr:heavy metal translocating P-type ATPase [Fundicoccus culcitae]UUX35447.1 copper-translocating P-type ATPase [Fundicoccus culcitae]
MDHSGHGHQHNHDEHNHDHSNHDHSNHDHSHHQHDHSDHDHSGHNHDHMDHSGHAHHHHGNFKEIFLKSLPLGIIIMILSPMMGITLPFQFTFPYSDILVAILATVLFIYGGKPFYQGAIDEFKQKSPGMMALVTLGISVSYIYSLYAVIARYVTGEHVMDFFFEFASLILIMLLGHWIEMKAVGDAGDAQASLAALVPKEAHLVLADGTTETRPVADLKVGDHVRVQAGENIPADGKIIRGESRVNESLLTGESKPISKKPDDTVIGGSTNGDGTLLVEVQETGDQSFVSQVQNLISQAQSQPSRAEGLAQKVAGWLFYIAVGVAAIAFVVWWLIADLQTAINYTVTTLVIACPHALGLAIPLVVARSTSLGASRGLLVKNREALELADKADVMILDKTGTLTTGEFKVLALESVTTNYSDEEVLALMAGIESGSSHPIAQSIVQHAKENNVNPTNFDSIENISGSGLKGQANGKEYQLISQKAYNQELDFNRPAGATISVLTENNQAIGVVALGDELKASSRDLIKELKEHNIQPIMATGDNEEAAKEVAAELGIDYLANQSPQDKYNLVEKLKNEGKTVIMVGDGVNDAPSLALADVGIAIGAGTQVAIDSADVILTQSDPADIASFLELASKTTRKMKENLVWGAGYNFIAIPLAAGLLAPIGITITPAVGAILMSLSTIIVAINAMTLRLDDRK